MSWTDKKAVEHIKKIRDIFKVKTFVETGTYHGINACFHSNNFEQVFSCEKNKAYFNESLKRMEDLFCKGKIGMVNLYNEGSKDFLKWFIKFYKKFLSKETIIFYLDAHFYDPKAKNRWVVLEELKVLKGFKKAIVIIHDFDNNLGHITYNGQSLNLDLVKKDLLKVNPNFKFYTNELSSCNPVTLNYKDILSCGLQLDNETIDNLEYAWTCPRLTYRGLLYCLPKEVKIEGFKRIK